MGETFGGGIDRQHEAALGARLPFVRENHELARHELAAVIVAHRPGDEQQLAFPDLALEERLTRPGTLERQIRKGQLLRSEEHTSELQSRRDLVCRLLLEKKKKKKKKNKEL